MKQRVCAILMLLAAALALTACATGGEKGERPDRPEPAYRMTY